MLKRKYGDTSVSLRSREIAFLRYSSNMREPKKVKTGSSIDSSRVAFACDVMFSGAIDIVSTI